ncbi:hypothetical protein VTN49DRAFT_7231 [Thermomyces lanuginosus]|uniref:uncharacterized protein n=1 Tax=Thermomyces lanuginosus TaxID=5541 RepID=UPI0037429E72
MLLFGGQISFYIVFACGHVYKGQKKEIGQVCISAGKGAGQAGACLFLMGLSLVSSISRAFLSRGVPDLLEPSPLCFRCFCYVAFFLFSTSVSFLFFHVFLCDRPWAWNIVYFKQMAGWIDDTAFTVWKKQSMF